MRKEIEDFQSFLIEEAKPYLEEEFNKGVGEKIIKGILYGEEVETNKDLREEEKFLSNVLLYFGEAQEALKKVKMASIRKDYRFN